MTPALLFAATLQDATDSAVTDWKWEYSDQLHFEFRRPDSGERVRFVVDQPHVMDGLRWNTTVYLGRNWNRRRDTKEIVGHLRTRFFLLGEPDLPPPRRRQKPRLEVLREELRNLLGEK